MKTVNYLELSVARMADADERRRNAMAQWQGDLYTPADIAGFRLLQARAVLHATLDAPQPLRTTTQVDAELGSYTAAYVAQNRHGRVPFPSCGLAVLAILDTAEHLHGLTRLAFVQAVVDRLSGWLADERSGAVPFDFDAGDAFDETATQDVATQNFAARLKSADLDRQEGSHEHQSHELVLGAFDTGRA